jgi:hypothetical protein
VLHRFITKVDPEEGKRLLSVGETKQLAALRTLDARNITKARLDADV